MSAASGRGGWSSRPSCASALSAQYREMIGAASRACEGQGIAHLDLNSHPRLRESPDELFLDSIHLNARAHARVAEIVAAELARTDGLE